MSGFNPINKREFDRKGGGLKPLAPVVIESVKSEVKANDRAKDKDSKQDQIADSADNQSS